jgi:hypothetical protein
MLVYCQDAGHAGPFPLFVLGDRIFNAQTSDLFLTINGFLVEMSTVQPRGIAV